MTKAAKEILDFLLQHHLTRQGYDRAGLDWAIHSVSNGILPI